MAKEESGGKFPYLDNSVDKGEKKKKPNKRRRKEMRKKRREKNGQRDRGRKGEKRKGDFSRYFDSQSSMLREEKSIHASRATRGYQKLGVSSNSTR